MTIATQTMRARCLSMCRVAWLLCWSTDVEPARQSQLERALLTIGVTPEQAKMMARAAIVDGLFAWGSERVPLNKEGGSNEK